MPAPGWYPDATVRDGLRWWTGRDWTEHRSTAAALDEIAAANTPRTVHHGVHATVTVVTLGAWLPVWLLRTATR